MRQSRPARSRGAPAPHRWGRVGRSVMWSNPGWSNHWPCLPPARQASESSKGCASRVRYPPPKPPKPNESSTSRHPPTSFARISQGSTIDLPESTSAQLDRWSSLRHARLYSHAILSRSCLAVSVAGSTISPLSCVRGPTLRLPRPQTKSI